MTGHSAKHVEHRHHFGATEREAGRNASDGYGTMQTRVSTDGQLAFGYCNLSNAPTSGDAVVSPSGRIYSKEAILEYILQQKRQIREKEEEVEQEMEALERKGDNDERRAEKRALDDFKRDAATNEIGFNDNSRKATAGGASIGAKAEDETFLTAKRQKKFDDKTDEAKLAEFKKTSPWMPMNTPTAPEAALVIVKTDEETGKRVVERVAEKERPTSPFSKNPIRVKDLVPLALQRDADNVKKDNSSSGVVRYNCAVSKKTITTQKVVLIKKTGAYMLESVAQELAYPDSICPITSKRFNIRKDVLLLKQSASAFSASGNVESKKYRPNL